MKTLTFQGEKISPFRVTEGAQILLNRSGGEYRAGNKARSIQLPDAAEEVPGGNPFWRIPVGESGVGILAYDPSRETLFVQQ